MALLAALKTVSCGGPHNGLGPDSFDVLTKCQGRFTGLARQERRRLKLGDRYTDRVRPGRAGALGIAVGVATLPVSCPVLLAIGVVANFGGGGAAIGGVIGSHHEKTEILEDFGGGALGGATGVPGKGCSNSYSGYCAWFSDAKRPPAMQRAHSPQRARQI